MLAIASLMTYVASFAISLGLIFCWKLVPETKGKHLEDIQAEFQRQVDRRA